MQETPRQYTQRILGYIDGTKPMEILAATPRQILRLVKGVPRRRLSRRPARDRWFITQILAHLADTELVVGFRIRLILGATGTPIQAFDQDVWAEYSDHAKQYPALSLESSRRAPRRPTTLV